jgi:hypothetical protein
MLSILSDVNEVKIGIAFEPISGNITSLVHCGLNMMHSGGRVHSTYKSSIGKSLAISYQHGL